MWAFLYLSPLPPSLQSLSIQSIVRTTKSFYVNFNQGFWSTLQSLWAFHICSNILSKTYKSLQNNPQSSSWPGLTATLLFLVTFLQLSTTSPGFLGRLFPLMSEIFSHASISKIPDHYICQECSPFPSNLIIQVSV